MGSCTAGGAYVPAMSDETVIVRTGTIFLGGPPLVKAATGEDVDPQELGGADVHARRSGVADHEAADDEHALRIVREVVANLNLPDDRAWQVTDPVDPAVDPAGLYGAIPQDLSQTYDVREVSRGSSTARRSTSSSSCTGHPGVRLRAHPRASGGDPREQRHPVLRVGAEGAHFVQLACERGTPLVFLQNITGFIVGREYEAAASRRTARSS